MSTTTLRFLNDEPIGTISPRLYGHFAEHLGRCCYDGLWVGPACTDIPHVDGFRRDIVDALRAMPTPMLRWPGGCYADHYHWRDGIGPAAERPVRLGLSCGLKVEDDNRLGTHEFLRFCELIGAEPYLAGNMGSGSVQEMSDWVEYCNASIPTKLVRERQANGRKEPFGVKLWGIGNENWGCGGEYDPESYGLEYRRYASMLLHVDPEIEPVVCGHTEDWNKRLVHTLRNQARFVRHFSIHRYWIGGGPGVAFTEEQYYRLLKEAEDTELFIQETRSILDEIDPEKRIGIALDEWGVWHPEARPWGPDSDGTMCQDYTQAATLRDAIATAVALEVFHRQCTSLSLANLAQIVNVLHAPIETDGKHMWLTPTYHVLQMHAPHIGAMALRVELEGAELLPSGGAAVSGTASRRGDKTAVTVTNRHFRQSATIRLPGASGSGVLLSAESAAAENSAFHPELVSPKPLSPKAVDGGLVVELPPFAVATVVIDG